MPLLRLIGLTLFITAIFLALIAAITKTTHIQVQIPGFTPSRSSSLQPDQSPSLPQVNPRSGLVLPPSNDGVFRDSAVGSVTTAQAQSESVAFTSVPIVWPLIIAAGVGLLMWFTHPGEPLRISTNAAKRRTRRRK